MGVFMETSLILKETFNIINKDFRLDREINNRQDLEDGLREIKENLTERIRYLMDHDYDKLMFILYRIDVNETKLKQAFKENSFDNMPPLIAGLVIERQLIKAKMRMQMKQDESGDR